MSSVRFQTTWRFFGTRSGKEKENHCEIVLVFAVKTLVIGKSWTTINRLEFIISKKHPGTQTVEKLIIIGDYNQSVVLK